VVDPTPEERDALLLEERDFWLTAGRRRGLLCRLWGRACPTPEDPCVPLAVIVIGDDGTVTRIDNCAPRNVLYSNAQLFDLILCLADRVDECCAEPEVMSLARESGDNQVGTAGQPLAAPLVARVTRDGDAVANEDVVFEALGDSRIGADGATLGTTFVAATDQNGDATLPVWRLGSGQGSHATLARIASGAPDQVIFKATARIEATLPVVRAVWPPPAVSLGRSENADWFSTFQRQRRLDVTFDRQMNPAHLDTPDGWLGLFVAVPLGDQVVVMRLPLTRMVPAPPGVLGVSGVTEVYRLDDSAPSGARVSGTLASRLREAAGVPPLAEENDGAGGEGRGGDAAAGGRPVAGIAGRARLATPGFITSVTPEGRVSVMRPEGFLGIAAEPSTPVPAAVRAIVLMRAVGGNIREAQAPNQLLDAEFRGGLLDPAVVKILWTMAPGATRGFTPAEVWDALASTGETLPESGDGAEGGEFQSWFEVAVGNAG
jgi:hypothetical protein